MGKSTTCDKSVTKALKGLEACKSQRYGVRVIHIRSPPVIKTSITDFKDVVQKLTGKERSSNPSLATTGNRHPVLLEDTNYYQSVNICKNSSAIGDPSAPVSDQIQYGLHCDQMIGALDYSKLKDLTRSENIALCESMDAAIEGFPRPDGTISINSVAS